MLFLDRGGVGTRDVANKKELIQEISKGLPVKIFTGNESVEEMVNLFNKAKFVLGVHGAMFVNTIFCNENAKIIELIPSTRIVVNMLQMNKSAIDHIGLVMESDNNHSFAVDPQSILKYLYS